MDSKRSRDNQDDGDLELLDTPRTINGRKRQKTKQDAVELCQECKSLDIDNSFLKAAEAFKKARKGRIERPSKLYGGRSGGPLFYGDAFFVHSFGSRLSEEAACPLCRFFWSMRIQATKHHEKYKLLGFCSSESWIFGLSGLKKSPAWHNTRDTVWMGVVPDLPSIPQSGHDEHWLDKDIPTVGPIYLLQAKEANNDLPALLEARQLGDGVDYTVVQEWFSFCRKWHLSSCSRPNKGDTITRGFRVIDCEKDTPAVVERPWGVEYAALSYVWGQRTEDLVDWPATVLDAVAVARKLGLRYLWVDRLCINQSDPVEKDYLISRMTTIYEYAELTIVSAAGSGASDGLPGIRSTPRKQQPKVLLESGSLLVSALQDPRQEILASEYWTRGWTYQEGVLSNRRLVFTENQAYWECRCMATQESLQMPLESVHKNHIPLENTTRLRREEISPRTRHGQHMEDYVLGGIFKSETSVDVSSGKYYQDVIQNDEHRLEYGFPVADEGSTRSQLRALNDHIRAFSARKLSYDGDSLKAFLGIAGMYRDKRLCIYLGIPVWMDDILGDLTGAYITFALSVCSWYHRSGTEHQMFIAEPCHRRTHLPSWTWAGWQGTVSWRAPPSDEHCVFMSDLITAEPLQVHLVWAADLYLRSACEPVCLRLLNLHSTDVLEAEVPTLLEIRKPLVLKYSIRHEVEGTWEWKRLAGRAGETRRYRAEREEWDKKWYRIGGRLACVSMSISITEQEWTRKHDAGELISVLIFAAQRPRSQHGRARFLTLQRVKSDSFETRWERVGTLQLTIPEVDLDRCLTNEQFLRRIPVREWGGAVVVK
ncbi:het-domain-containing [Trichoderma arundinaceum]|uniref:Het-domain-containing n=1 Tax=Trichoderma arundinaceum TaxID=490622 RepID=A0A395P0I3_TRIAR|nr:het-domain-containing [Trichoderma arundinaceum]